MMKQIWMKKACLFLFCMTLVISLAGCAGKGNGETASTESQKVETTDEAGETAGTIAGKNPPEQSEPAETAFGESQTGQTSNHEPAAAGATTAETGGQAAPAAQSQGITEEDAKRIAFEHAGVNEGDLSYLKVKLERDHGRDEYDVEFFVGNKEYDYDIDAATGEILSYDYDAESDMPGGAQNQNGGNSPAAGTQNNNGAFYITQDQAKAVALAHANVSEGEISKLKIEFDQDHGKAEYDVEFKVDRTEYEYEIDAVTGEILSFETDRD